MQFSFIRGQAFLSCHFVRTADKVTTRERTPPISQLAIRRTGCDTWEGPHVTETIESTVPPASDGAAKKRSSGLNSLLLADLKTMAGGLGISGTSSMKKAQLVAAISSAQGQESTEIVRPEASRPMRRLGKRKSQDAPAQDASASQTSAPESSVQDSSAPEIRPRVRRLTAKSRARTTVRTTDATTTAAAMTIATAIATTIAIPGGTRARFRPAEPQQQSA